MHDLQLDPLLRPHEPAARTWRSKYLAEALGTFAIVFVGTGSIIVSDISRGSLSPACVPLIFGLVVAAMIWGLGPVSGAHFNPAVSAAFCLAGCFPRSQVLAYAAAQCSGALVASLLLRAMLGSHAAMGSTVPSGSVWLAFGLEVLITLVLMLVILSVSHIELGKSKGLIAGVVIGGTVAFEAVLAGPICGASMNPARSLGPALVSGALSDLWIYLVAPPMGALLAVPLFRVLYGRSYCSTS